MRESIIISPSDRFWETLFLLAPIKRPKPASTLYDVIVDTRDLDTVKRFVAGGHAIAQRFAGGDSVSLSVTKGDLEFVRYFVENSTDTESANELLAKAVRRISESVGDQLVAAKGIFDFLLEQPFARSQFASAYTACATYGQVSAAQVLIEAGLEDHDIRIGPNEYTKLSDRLTQLGHTEFVALLQKEPVDHQRMLRQERKEQKRNAELKDILANATVFDGQRILSGDEFKKQHRALLADIESGKWRDELASYDPRFGRSVIEFAAANNLADLVSLILEVGPMPKKEAERASLAAAVAAATYGHLDVLKLLQEKGVAVQATPAGSRSPLSEACRYGHYDVVSYLLQLGADPTSSDGSGHRLTLADIAGGEDRSKIIAALEG